MILRGEEMELLFDFLAPYIFIGAEGIIIEGVKHIKKWDRGEIVVTSPINTITLAGKKLEIEQKTTDTLLIKGAVSSMTFGELKK